MCKTENERNINIRLKEKCMKILNELKLKSIYAMIHYDVKEQWMDEMKKDAEEQINLRGINDFRLSSELTPLQKLCCYRVSNEGVDCDVALRSMIVNFLACDFEEKKLCIRLQKGESDQYDIVGKEFDWILRGDTMNSYATPIVEHFLWDKADIFDRKFKYPRGVAILCEYDYFEKKLSNVGVKEAMRYMELVHTMGNFLLVPFVKENIEFNRPRGMGTTKDYWDLALKGIYDWYREKNDDHIKKIVGTNNVNNVELCRNWLESFDDWDGFVATNMMQGFVDENNVPKLFWEGHTVGKVKPNVEELKEFLKNTCESIEKRGEAIAEKVHNKLENLDECGLNKLADKMAGLEMMRNETYGE